jgi:hypothetical protein
MPITMQHERDNIFRVELRGTLRKLEFERCQQNLLTEMQRIGLVRLLLVLQGFDGWELHAGWNDLYFYVTNGNSIERIAIVGPERWRSEALMFAAADLRRAPVEFFREDALADARTWLSA